MTLPLELLEFHRNILKEENKHLKQQNTSFIRNVIKVFDFILEAKDAETREARIIESRDVLEELYEYEFLIDK